MAEPEVLFEQRGRLGLITLNRPKALNALTWGMVKAIDQQLAAWEQDDRVAVVAIQGAGDKAFAAGGDIRWLYDNGAGGQTGQNNFQFFADEYRLNTRIKCYPKPYVAIMDGIVMGGGVGVSIHGALRIATERTTFAMPETGIGLFPDVGGTYFLPRLPGHTGMKLGLTGARLRGEACCQAGLCDAVLPSDRIDAYLDFVAAGGTVEPYMPGEFDGWLDRAGDAVEPGSLTDDPFGRSSVDEVLDALKSSQSEQALKDRKTILSKSPTSTRIAFRQIREGAKLDFEDCMRLEYRLARYCMTHPDFYEGVRALIIDKDNDPKWSPASLEEATEGFVAEAFETLGEQELDLP